MSNTNLATNELKIKQVDFSGSKLMCIQNLNTDEIFVGINWILEGLGFDESKVRYQRDKWLEDKVIFKGVQKFSHPSKGGLQETFCLNIKKLPLALAKIRLTPAIEKEHPELVCKLELYQDECADILANAFLGDSSNVNKCCEKLDFMFSQNRTIKTFENAKVSELNDLYAKFRLYIDDELKYKTDDRLARYKSVEKGLSNLHDNLAKDVINIGDCYNIRKLKEVVLTDRTTLEKRISGGEKAAQKKKIKGLTTTVFDLTHKLKNSIIYPNENEFITLPTHGFSNNSMYEQIDTPTPVKTEAYNRWINKFPMYKLLPKDQWNVDWSKPIEVFLNYVAKEHFDSPNFDKSAIDMIIQNGYGVNDNIVHLVHSQRIGTCENFWDGSISYFIRNIQ